MDDAHRQWLETFTDRWTYAAQILHRASDASVRAVADSIGKKIVIPIKQSSAVTNEQIISIIRESKRIRVAVNKLLDDAKNAGWLRHALLRPGSYFASLQDEMGHIEKLEPLVVRHMSKDVPSASPKKQIAPLTVAKIQIDEAEVLRIVGWVIDRLSNIFDYARSHASSLPSGPNLTAKTKDINALKDELSAIAVGAIKSRKQMPLDFAPLSYYVFGFMLNKRVLSAASLVGRPFSYYAAEALLLARSKNHTSKRYREMAVMIGALHYGIFGPTQHIKEARLEVSKALSGKFRVSSVGGKKCVVFAFTAYGEPILTMHYWPISEVHVGEQGEVPQVGDKLKGNPLDITLSGPSGYFVNVDRSDRAEPLKTKSYTLAKPQCDAGEEVFWTACQWWARGPLGYRPLGWGIRRDVYAKRGQRERNLYRFSRGRHRD